MIYSIDILPLKTGKKVFEETHKSVIKGLNREREENEEYSEWEWEEIPRPKSRVKEEKLNPVISVWHSIPLSDDYRLPIAYKTGWLPVPGENI